MEVSNMVLELAACVGAAGREESVFQKVSAMLESVGACENTPLGALVCRVKEGAPNQPHLMLTAHMDEIGMIVTFIDDKGFLRVGNVGGVDRSALFATEVVVHAADGDLHGVICTVPPHLSTDDKKLPKIEDICIDLGMDAQTVHGKVALGDRISWRFEPGRLLDGSICSKALDDRAGCVAVIMAVRELAKMELSCSLTVLLSSMEEAGGQGARTGTFQIAPTHAIAVDVSFAHTPDAVRSKCGEIGKGVMIGVSPILDNQMLTRMKALAREKQIPFQMEVMGGNTGTDADAAAVSGVGVRCALLSIPLKYMHTPVEVVLPSDVQATADLMVAYVCAEFGGKKNAV